MKASRDAVKELKAARDSLNGKINDLEDKIAKDTNHSVPQEEQLKNWAKHLEDSLEIGKDIDNELDKAKDE